MKKYKITYFLNGNIRVVELEAKNIPHAKTLTIAFYHPDDFISIEEVTE